MKKVAWMNGLHLNDKSGPDGPVEEAAAYFVDNFLDDAVYSSATVFAFHRQWLKAVPLRLF